MKPWTTEEENELRSLHRQGMSIREMAARLDRSIPSVRSRKKLLRCVTDRRIPADPELSTLLGIARALQCSVDDLIERKKK